jgi:hypothetical protein
MASALAVKRRHEKRLLRLQGVLGVALAEKDGEACIRIFVEEDRPEILNGLPRILEDVPVDVVVSGKFKAL